MVSRSRIAQRAYHPQEQSESQPFTGALQLCLSPRSLTPELRVDQLQMSHLRQRSISTPSLKWPGYQHMGFVIKNISILTRQHLADILCQKVLEWIRTQVATNIPPRPGREVWDLRQEKFAVCNLWLESIYMSDKRPDAWFVEIYDQP